MTRRFAISDRMRSILIATSVLAFIFGSLIVATFEEGQYRTQVAATAGVQARILADTVSAALAFDDREALREYVGALRADRQVDAVGVFDNHGRLAASFTRSHIAQNLPSVATPAMARGQVIVFAPVTQSGTRLGTVYLRDRTEPLLTRLSRYVAPGLLVVMALMLFVVTSLDARTLQRVNRDLQGQILEREKAEVALRQSQKMEAIGRLTGGIAHDFNNMLAIVIGSLDLLIRRHAVADEKMSRLVENAMEGAQRAAGLTQRLLAFSRQQPLKPISADIARSVKETTVLLRRTLGESIAIETVSAAGLWRAHIDLPQLETAVVNLAINARDAMPSGGKLTIETANTYLDKAYAETFDEVVAGQYVLVAISDTGMGIPAELLDQVFEPFFTTKPVGMGTGLGLSQVLGFIRQSGGHVRIYSEVGVGTTVKLYLPRSFEEGSAPPAVAATSRAQRRRDLTVLVVEDEAGVRDFATEALNELGYDVLSADSAKSALRILEDNAAVAIMLTDVIMPETNGRALAELALARRPSLCVVFMTGYTRNAIVHNGVLDAGAWLVSKPFTVTQLGAELDAAMAGHRAR
jgi:signal transduction histidine kinase/ActR/RegA family two-component response regulator